VNWKGRLFLQLQPMLLPKLEMNLCKILVEILERFRGFNLLKVWIKCWAILNWQRN
jgi:hypothetical protein